MGELEIRFLRVAHLTLMGRHLILILVGGRRLMIFWGVCLGLAQVALGGHDEGRIIRRR